MNANNIALSLLAFTLSMTKKESVRHFYVNAGCEGTLLQQTVYKTRTRNKGN